MSIIKYIVVVVGTFFYLVNGHKEKSSLTFVIDVTTTMGKEIEQVKMTTDKIFDRVLNSKTNNIDDFVLVTFGDPSVNLTAKTRDRNVFKQALQSIELQHGGFCPEASMEGIIVALKNSHPNSFIYVFTDASAHDYPKLATVKSLSQKLSSQVNFLLTGKCKFAKSITNVYDDVAEAASGHIFNIKKDDVTQIINFVVENLKSKNTVLKRKVVEDNFDQQIPFTIDSKIFNVFICVSSKDPHFSVYNSEGEKIKVLEVVKTEKNSIVKLEKEVNGTYFVKLEQNDRTLVTVTSSTSICFQHGFSTTEPASLNDTSIKPNGDFKEPHFLSIQLDNEERDVLLQTAELLDLQDNVLITLPLLLIDDEEQFYISDAFNVPNGMFRIAIIGYTSTNEEIRRVTIATIQRPDPDIEKNEESDSIAPSVNILAEPKISVDFNKKITITCKVRAVPIPIITWVDTYGQEVQPKIIKYDYPYYGSVLTVDKVDKEGKMTCKAKNSVGQEEKSVILEINRKVEVTTTPTTTSTTTSTTPSVTTNTATPAPPTKIYEGIVGDLALQIPCEIPSQGTPKPNIKWEYEIEGNVTQLSKQETDQYKISNNILILKNIDKSFAGFYKCSYDNLNSNNWNVYEVQVKEYPIPIVYELRPKHTLDLGKSLSLPCNKEDPRGDFQGLARWYKDGYFVKSCSDNVVCNFDLVNVTSSDTGVYMCRTSTMEYSITFNWQVIVVSQPEFINEVQTIINYKENELVILDCSSYGEPTPEIVWSVGSQIISKNSTYSFIMEIDKIAEYKCKVSNEKGTIQRTFEIKSDKVCPLNVMFHRNMPLFLSPSSTWILGSLDINMKIKIICIDSVMSDNTRSFPGTLEAKCLENTLFQTNKYGIIDISELKCDKAVDLTVKNTNTDLCIAGPSQQVRLGFQLGSLWVGVFDACFDINRNVTAFIKYNMYLNKENQMSAHNEDQLLPLTSEVDSGCRIIEGNKCCFVKKPLLSARDMLPGLQQLATYADVNFIPQWSTCGTENWDEVGERVRTLSKSLNKFLEIWIGTSEFLYKNKNIDTAMTINDNFYGTTKVPRYIWKVIFNKIDSKRAEGLAIIVTNIPHSLDKCEPPCTDVCDQITWMKSSQWQNVSKGCVFCCSIGDFMKIFHYENMFPSTKLLN